MEVLFIEGRRNGYSVTQCKSTLTVGELINLLEEYDTDVPVYLNHDNFSYGSITENDIYIEDVEEDEGEEYDDE